MKWDHDIDKRVRKTWHEIQRAESCKSQQLHQKIHETKLQTKIISFYNLLHTTI